MMSAYISDPFSHAKWLNTLSFLENSGARKIARNEDPQTVSKQMLKHAAEEFRHAFYLKSQITSKLGIFLPSYRFHDIWGGLQTLRYLDRLEAMACRLVKAEQAVYFLVTFAIELRAFEIYPIYQDLLSQMKSCVSVRSILLEEKGHLEEMREQIASLSLKEETTDAVCHFEGMLCQNWLEKLESEHSCISGSNR